MPEISLLTTKITNCKNYYPGSVTHSVIPVCENVDAIEEFRKITVSIIYVLYEVKRLGPFYA